MSVLAHIVLDGRFSAEPTVTRALAYVLSSLPCVTDAFVDPLCRGHVDGFDLGPVRIDRRSLNQDDRPDLTLRDADNRARVVVENKFWARLTERQPVSYLENLLDDQPSALLFIAPAQRIPALWAELIDRCGAAGLEFVDERDENCVISARIAPARQRVLLITSWTRVLDVLTEATRGGERSDVLCDVAQLRALVTQHPRRYRMPSASIVWWYGPYDTMEELREAAIGFEIPVVLYMALSGHTVRRIGWTDDPAVQFGPAQPHRDRDFLHLAEAEHTYYLGQLAPPAPAGPNGLQNAASNAVAAFNSVLFNGHPPDEHVSLFSSFCDTQMEMHEGDEDYPLRDPPTGFAVVIAFNPYPPPPGEANWIVVRAPTGYATTGDIAQLRAELAALRAAVMGGNKAC